MTSFLVTDFLGVTGVILVLAAYVMLQMQKILFDDYSFLILNALGAGLIIVSLIFKFNPASFLIESCWLAISLYGLWRKLSRGSRKQEITK